ncbi:hypothetical protein TRIUR3_34333 [Triticum urartu]|uniref:Uncharacterized protein n=1 Tax=Triticum urartu TaxID=4572 RepID=M7Z7P8_TRIUA|nr:hypothetical protein TRIUR3_34333 [Triticum urartu]
MCERLVHWLVSSYALGGEIGFRRVQLPVLIAEVELRVSEGHVLGQIMVVRFMVPAPCTHKANHFDGSSGKRMAKAVQGADGLSADGEGAGQEGDAAVGDKEYIRLIHDGP